MKKSELKKLIKPLVKECINEVLLEEGLLSNVVSEVAKGMQGQTIVSEAAPAPKPVVENKQKKQAAIAQRRKLMDAIGNDAYNGVDLFEGTTPMSSQAEPRAGAIDLGDPGDSGVDISNLIGGATKMWDLMK
ncbi:MAG: hypothetical protein CMF52_07330 [Legionellales bacterium]|nr:hypothetical protein [Legionellales bacterium]